MFVCFFFFFKQKTAYEILRSDWSSDVCSSDLPARPRGALADRRGGADAAPRVRGGDAAGPRRRSAAQPREERHGRVGRRAMVGRAMERSGPDAYAASGLAGPGRDRHGSGGPGAEPVWGPEGATARAWTTTR